MTSHISLHCGSHKATGLTSTVSVSTTMYHSSCQQQGLQLMAQQIRGQQQNTVVTEGIGFCLNTACLLLCSQNTSSGSVQAKYHVTSTQNLHKQLEMVD